MQVCHPQAPVSLCPRRRQPRRGMGVTYHDQCASELTRRAVLGLGDQADEVADEPDDGHQRDDAEGPAAHEGIAIVSLVLDGHLKIRTSRSTA